MAAGCLGGMAHTNLWGVLMSRALRVYRKLGWHAQCCFNFHDTAGVCCDLLLP